jgi:hypothetical protein
MGYYVLCCSICVRDLTVQLYRRNDFTHSGVETRNYKQGQFTLISVFHRDVDEIRGLLGYYTASCGNCLQTFRDNVLVNNYHTTQRNMPVCKSLLEKELGRKSSRRSMWKNMVDPDRPQMTIYYSACVLHAG